MQFSIRISFLLVYIQLEINLYIQLISFISASKHTFTFLQKCPETKQIYSKCKLIKSKRQPPSLKNILTSAKLTHTTIFSVTKCNSKKCHLCLCIIEGSSFDFKNYKFTVNANMNCNTKNCIYVIRCENCGLLYIGETGNLRSRVNLHKSHVNKKEGLFVNKHLAECNTNLKDTFKIMPFYKVKQDDERIRKEKETYFIQKFHPELNK